jgi:hypothetical protein
MSAVVKIPKPSGINPRILVRFRHPDKAPIQSVKVNGRSHLEFDAESGDVNISGLKGNLTLEASY